MGGYVALSLAARHPETLRALVLADTRADPDDQVARGGREAGIAAIRRDGLAAYLDRLLPRLLAPAAERAVQEQARAIAEAQEPEAVVAALEAMRDRPSRVSDLGRIRVSTLVVMGADDQVTPREAAVAMADGIPGARLELLEHAGHLSALERPAAFASAVRAFLEEAMSVRPPSSLPA